ncbi:hypothetical protein DENSPDRAFT_885532 [Dentipellis sp. KUC8613]|nr:hypothetical protein DENSPDRAFT_885532 [Dentipellis sp. KUC8613]
MADALSNSVAQLGSDLFAQKLYYVATATLWIYDYFLTLGDEVEYAYSGGRAYKVFLTIRVYAITKKHKAIVVFAIAIILWQWGIAVYVMSQSSKGTDLPALLLSRRDAGLPPLPTLPDIDPFHVCIFISTLTVTPWVEAFLCLSLAFDIVVFLVIIVTTTKAIQTTHIRHTLHVIQRDGILYFFVLFSSNLVWLVLVLHARPGLKFMHNQSAMIISSIMINRITLHLKRISHKHSVIPWSVQTFEERSSNSRRHLPSSSDENYELRNISVISIGPDAA